MRRGKGRRVSACPTRFASDEQRRKTNVTLLLYVLISNAIKSNRRISKLIKRFSRQVEKIYVDKQSDKIHKE